MSSEVKQPEVKAANSEMAAPEVKMDAKVTTPAVSINIEKKFKTLAEGLNKQMVDGFKALAEKQKEVKPATKTDIWETMRKRALDSNFVAELSKRVRIRNAKRDG